MGPILLLTLVQYTWTLVNTEQTNPSSRHNEQTFANVIIGLRFQVENIGFCNFGENKLENKAIEVL